MKKIIMTFTALALAVCAYAKTLQTLADEYAASTDKTAYVRANSADIAAAFGSWTFSDVGANFNLFSGAFNATKGTCFEPTEYVGICLGTQTYYDNAVAADSGYYGKLKARGFVCDGKKIPAFRIMFLSSFAGDNDYIVSLDPSEVIGRGGVGTYLKKIRPLLLSASDKSAYDKTIAIENAISEMSAGAEKTAALSDIRDLQDAIYLRITRANKIK